MKKKYIIAAVVVVLLTVVIALVMGRESSAKKAAELLDLGNKYLLEQDYEQAIVAFEKLIEIEPMNVDAYLGLAEAYVGIGNTEEAIAALEKGYELTSSEEILKKLEELREAVEEPEEAAEEVTEKEPAGEAPQRSDAKVYQTIVFDDDTQKFIDSIIAACVDGQFEKARDMMADDAFKNVLDQYGYLSEPTEYLKYRSIIRTLHKEARVYMDCDISIYSNGCLFAYLPQSGTGFVVSMRNDDYSNDWGYVKGDVAGYSFNGSFDLWERRGYLDTAEDFSVEEQKGTLVDNCYEGKVIKKVTDSEDYYEESYRMYENGHIMSLGNEPDDPKTIIYERTVDDRGWSGMDEESFRDQNQKREVCVPCGGGYAPAPWEEVK